MTTPTGTSPTSRATRSAADSRAAPTIAEIGSTRRAAGPDHEPDDVRHDQPDEADEPADRDAGRGRQRGERQQDAALAPDVDAEMARGGIAEEQAVEGPRSQHHEDAGSDDQGRRDGEAGPRRTREPAEQEREDLAQVGTRHVHRHRQERRQHGPDGVAGEEEAGQPTRAAGAPEPEHDERRQQGSGEGEAVQEAELDEARSGPGSGPRSPPRAPRPTPCPARTDRPAGCAATPGTWRRRRRAPTR